MMSSSESSKSLSTSFPEQTGGSQLVVLHEMYKMFHGAHHSSSSSSLATTTGQVETMSTEQKIITSATSSSSVVLAEGVTVGSGTVVDPSPASDCPTNEHFLPTAEETEWTQAFQHYQDPFVTTLGSPLREGDNMAMTLQDGVFGTMSPSLPSLQLTPPESFSSLLPQIDDVRLSAKATKKRRRRPDKEYDRSVVDDVFIGAPTVLQEVCLSAMQGQDQDTVLLIQSVLAEGLRNLKSGVLFPVVLRTVCTTLRTWSPDLRSQLFHSTFHIPIDNWVRGKKRPGRPTHEKNKMARSGTQPRTFRNFLQKLGEVEAQVVSFGRQLSSVITHVGLLEEAFRRDHSKMWQKVRDLETALVQKTE